MQERVKVGDKFRDFSLEDQNEEVFTLSKFKGKRVLLSFHPLAWTSVCSEQMKSLEKNKEAFDSLNTIAVGVSVDTVPSKKAWAKSLNIENTRLLSDFWPHGKVAETYGIFRSKYGTSERANIIIDENQKVAFVKVYPVEQLPDIKEVTEALRKLG
ncbi:MAG: redoxin domain-containing protein [Candidatus Bathyarchaeia archaeon]|jgi:peroxiredoxin